jgi:PHP family Zn ribbon phosphoesterase
MSQSRGLNFKKLDLHLHTPASKCFRDKTVTSKQVVEAALAKGLSAIAITDHNSGAWIDDVKAAAKGSGLVVFPGVEITCQGGKGGLHIIALFDPSAGKSDVEGLLNELKLQAKEFGSEDALVKESPHDVFAAISRRGGIAVLAHANSTHGVLQDMTGQQRTAIINDPHVMAAEGTDFQDADKAAKKKRVVDLLSGSDQSYRKLAVYQASDNPLCDGSGEHGIEGIGTRCAFYKLDQINLDGLRQCLYDPDVRIRQDYEFTEQRYPYIKEIAITSGFLDGATASFHQGLNSVLGGKGTGKSLLIEFLRFVLDQQPENEEIRQDHDQKLRDRLQEFGAVEITVVDETGKEYKVKRTYLDTDDAPFDDDAHSDIARIFPVLFLSQTEIIKIAENPESQIEFIDRFFDFRSYKVQIAQIEHDLGLLDKKYADALRARTELGVLTKSIATIDTDLERLNNALKNPVFERLRQLELKESTFKEQIASITQIIDPIAEVKTTIEESTGLELPESLSKDAALLRVQKSSNQAKQSALDGIEKLITDLRKIEQSAQGEYRKWSPELDSIRKEYNSVVQNEGGDYKKLAARRTKVLREREDVNKRLAGVRTRANQIKTLAEERNEKLRLLRAVYSDYSKERRDKCRMFEKQSVGRLKITLHEATDREAFKDKLLSLKRGSYFRDAEINGICESAEPSAFIRALIVYAVDQKLTELNEIANKATIEAARMRSLADYLLETFEIEELLRLQYIAMPEDRPEIRYHLGGEIYESVDKLSIGQKCTAMLIMALSDGTTPVVIDQPEDSLDIRSVWEDMCLKIRSGKERRQFVFTTHNSSLAVASDSDKFIILEAEATKGRVVFSGSMDHDPVSDEVLRYLEGGPDTYRMKFLKYNVNNRKR